MGNDRSPESQHNVWRPIFYNAQRPVTLNLNQRSGLNSSIEDVMPILINCKYPKDQNKNGRKKNCWKLYLSDAKAANFVVSGWIWPIFKLIHFIYVIVIYEKEDQSFCQAHRGLPVGFLLLWYSVLCSVESYLCFISFLYLDLYVLGGDAWIS